MHKQCKFCGKGFYAVKDDKNRKQLYCSRKCYGKSMKGRKATAIDLINLGKGRKWNKGLVGIGGWRWSKESKAKLSKSKFGKKLSLEHRQALSKAKKGKPIKHFWGENTKKNKQKISTALKGKAQPWNTDEKHHDWKGNGVGYFGLHAWVTRKKGRPHKCEICGTTTAKKYEWANIDHSYTRDLDDYIRLCTRCHRNYDMGNVLNYANAKT